MDCLALPPEQRPTKPRPTPHGGIRSRRCSTHWRLFVEKRRRDSHARHVLKTYGLSEEEQVELWEYQGRVCPCSRVPTRRPDTDHNHRCPVGGHPSDKGCRHCVRGMCCRGCNTYVIGRYSAKQLRALADYLDDPPWQRLRRLKEETP